MRKGGLCVAIGQFRLPLSYLLGLENVCVDHARDQWAVRITEAEVLLSSYGKEVRGGGAVEVFRDGVY